ncbi:MAG: dTDP-4-dehydrorhamnose reductase [Candidatus Saccharibacteria bacterium]|nr:dTDP-4-dehydrorhamnose reductase [Candidatus Saccharibacteria bacterium]
MKILITGSNGMLAQSVKAKFEKENELILTDSKELDITNKQNVLSKIKELKPELIINCAAYTNVDGAEENEELCKRVNGDGPKNLALGAKEVGATLVHISTDYVFGGSKDISEEYSEDDEKSPESVYGKTKLAGEEGIIENTDKFYIFRTAWLYGLGNNFVRTMLNVGRTHDEVTVVSDQHGSPTYCEDLTDIIYQAVTKKIPYGVYNSTNEGYTTWFDFTKEIFKQVGLSTKVNPTSTEEYMKNANKTVAKRPLNSKMSKEKLKSAGIVVPDWKDALKRYLIKEGEING